MSAIGWAEERSQTNHARQIDWPDFVIRDCRFSATAPALLYRRHPCRRRTGARLPFFACAKKGSKESTPQPRQNRSVAPETSARRFDAIGYGHALMRRPAQRVLARLCIDQHCAGYPCRRTRPLASNRRLARKGPVVLASSVASFIFGRVGCVLTHSLSNSW